MITIIDGRAELIIRLASIRLILANVSDVTVSDVTVIYDISSHNPHVISLYHELAILE